jgi:uncharacterized protein YndB with AHSA1/START domain
VSHHVIDIERVTTAAPDAVWRWLADASSWREWTRLSRTRLVREGEPAPDGVGAIRHFALAGGSSREEVVVFDPPHHLAYVLLQGLPVLNYRADVTLEPTGAGTRILWHSTFDAKYPGTGRVMRAFLRSVLSDTATRLAARAEQGMG